MAKAKEQVAAEEDQSAEMAMPEHSHPEPESLAALKERFEEALGMLMAHEARLARVEQLAHNNHTLEPEAVQAIGDHVMGRVHKTFGHSGMPVRGDQ